MPRATQKQSSGDWAEHPASRRRFLALTALCFASLGFGKSRGKGSPEGRFKGEGQKQDKSRASQVTPGRLQRPAVRAAFRTFTGQERNSENCLESLIGVRFWGHFREENHALASAFPKSLLSQRLEAGSIVAPGTFGRRNRHHEEGRPTIKICTAENKEKALPSADVPGCELHHCLQRKGAPAQGKKYVSELITLSISYGYSLRGVVWCVATEGGTHHVRLHEGTERQVQLQTKL